MCKVSETGSEWAVELGDTGFLWRLTEGWQIDRRFDRIGALVRAFVLVIGSWVKDQPALSRQTPAPATPRQTDRLAALEKTSAEQATAIAAAQSAGDNAWMLTSSALVLMMTGPGLALFYGGLVRRKNVLATMMQSFTMMAVITVLWAFVGYSLAFGRGQRLHRRLAVHSS